MAERLEEVFINRVREIAAEKNLPLSHVADRAGMARSYLWRLLANESSPTLDAIQRLAVALEVDDPLVLLSDRSTQRPSR